MTELLAPAGNMPSLKAALAAGADAVYLGGQQYSARAYADNFSKEELLEAIRLAHLHHRKLYLTVNTLIREQELALLPAFLRPFYEEGLDGLIIADTGAIRLVHELFPDLPLHASTQMTLTGPLGADLLASYGITRIVPARELSFDELAALKAGTDLELEVFIHGAMCYAYSGQCLFSSMLGKRSGNRGRCAGACRLPYRIYAGEEAISSSVDAYQLSLKDLCALPVLGELLDLGIDSFKIEGRMKSAEYVYFVTSLYRKYMDRHVKGQEVVIEEQDLAALQERFNRGSLQTGYFHTHGDRSMLMLSRAGYTGSKEADGSLDEKETMEPAGIETAGELYLQPDKNTIYKMRVLAPDKHFEVQVSGEAVQIARNAPVEFENLQERFARLGDTPYVLSQFTLFYRDTDDAEYGEYDAHTLPPLFLTVKAMKQLRRQAAEALTQELLASRMRTAGRELSDYLEQQKTIKPTLTGSLKLSVRTAKDKKNNRTERLALFGRTTEPENQSFSHMVRLRTMEQLRAICKELYDRIDILCLSYDLVKVRGLVPAVMEIADRIRTASGGKVYLSLPLVSRRVVIEEYERVLDESLLAAFDGVICANLESVAFLQGMDAFRGRIVTDAGLYLFQSESARFYEDLGIREHILPYELQRNEISELLSETADLGHGFYLPIYGHIPVMVSAECVRNTNHACLKELPSAARRQKEVLRPVYLRDRMNKSFPVNLHCDRCENTIYNCVPLSLHKELNQIGQMPLAGDVYSFTVENGKQTGEILNFYLGKEQAVPAYLRDFTKGHFLKGVE